MQFSSPQSTAGSSFWKFHQFPKYRLALVLTALLASLGGIGIGTALRFQLHTADHDFLNPAQSFPPLADWPPAVPAGDQVSDHRQDRLRAVPDSIPAYPRVDASETPHTAAPRAAAPAPRLEASDGNVDQASALPDKRSDSTETAVSVESDAENPSESAPAAVPSMAVPSRIEATSRSETPLPLAPAPMVSSPETDQGLAETGSSL